MGKKVAFFAGHYDDLFDEEGSKGIYTNTEADGQYEEYDSNIVIARQAVQELRQVPGLTVYFPQGDGSDYRSLRSRVDYCNRHGVDIAIFVHSNAASSRSAHGACAFYYYTSDDGKRMALIYKDEMSNANYPLWSNGTYGCNPDDGWSNFYVVENTSMPVLLTENFFFTNPQELRDYLQDETDLRKIGHIHARVACRSLGIDTGHLSVVKSVSTTDNILQSGERGDAVKSLQEKLIKAGQDLDKYGADGDYGKETENAVRTFQKRHELAVDGIAGPKTQAKLKEVINVAETGFKDVPKDARYAEAIKWLKEKGIMQGYTDGTFGIGDNIKREDFAVALYEALK